MTGANSRWRDIFPAVIILLLSLFFFRRVIFGDELLAPNNFTLWAPWDRQLPARLSQASQARQGYPDPLLAYYPRVDFAARAIRAGELPLWNPTVFSGMPFMADIQTAVFYPLSALFLLFDPWRAVGYSAFVHLSLAGLFMYGYLRTIGLARPAALLGGLALMFSNIVASRVAHIPRLNTIAWLPFLCLAFELYLQSEPLFAARAPAESGVISWFKRAPLPARALPLALGVTMSILAGFVPVTVLSLYLLTLYAGFRLLGFARQAGLSAASRAAVAVGLAGLAGVLLAAVQLLPTLELSRYAAGGQVQIREALYAAKIVDRWDLFLALGLMPELLGNPISAPDLFQAMSNVFGARVYLFTWVGAAYLGLVPLCLIAIGLVQPKDRTFDLRLFFAGLILVLLVVLNWEAAARFLYAVLPGWRVGTTLRLLVIYVFALAALAALGCEALLRQVNGKRQGRRERVVAAGVLALGAVLLVTALTGMAVERFGGNRLALARSLALALARADDAQSLLTPEILAGWAYKVVVSSLTAGGMLLVIGVVLHAWAAGRLPGTMATWALVGLAAADLLFFAARLTPLSQAREGIYPATPFVEFLRRDPARFRLMRLADEEADPDPTLAPPNILAVYGLADAQGYNSLNLEQYGRFMALVDPAMYPEVQRSIRPIPRPELAASPLFDLLNVKYFLANSMSQAPLEDGSLARELALVYDADVKIYENLDVLPRAFVPAAYRVISDVDGMPTALRDPAFNPAAELLITGPAPDGSRSGQSPATSNVQITSYGMNAVTIQADMAAAGFMVLADTYYPGWQASVDGEATAIYPAYGVVRAVWVPAGAHTVEFVYDPPALRRGFAISLVTALFGSGWSIVGLARRPSRTAAGDRRHP